MINAAIKFSLGLVFPRVGFFQGHIDQISTVLWVYQSAVFMYIFATTDLVSVFHLVGLSI